jgi:phage gp29-like protein
MKLLHTLRIRAARALLPRSPAPRPMPPASLFDLRGGSLFANRRATPEQILAVLQQAATGGLAAQWELFSMMEDTWARLAKNLGEVRRAAARATYIVNPATLRGAPPTPAARAKADLVDAALRNWLPRPGTLETSFEDTLFGCLDALGKGVSVTRIDWAPDARGRLLPRAGRLLGPSQYGWDAAGAELGLLDARGGWAPFEPGRCLVGIWHARSGAPGATATLRALTPHWLGATLGWQWLLANAQLFGVPFRWATYDPSQPQLAALLDDMLSHMGATAHGVFPDGTAIEFKEVSTSVTGNPQVVIQQMADRACDLLILGQELSGSAQPAGLGSASADLQGAVRADRLAAAAQWCADLLNYQLVPAVLRANLGDTTEPPVITASLGVAEDPKALAERDAILLGAGVALPKAWLYERHGIPAPQPGEEVVTPPSNLPPPPPAATQAPAAAPAARHEPASGPQTPPAQQASTCAEPPAAGGNRAQPGQSPVEATRPRPVKAARWTGADLAAMATAYQDKARFVRDMRILIGAEEGDTGRMTDIESSTRLGLIHDMNAEEARARAKWDADQDPDALAAFPAQELVRSERRENPRDWPARWQAAGGTLTGGNRMVALKSDPIWRAISAFDRPWPPFDFGSGMALIDVSRKEAEALGILRPGQSVPPPKDDYPPARTPVDLAAALKPRDRDNLPLPVREAAFEGGAPSVLKATEAADWLARHKDTPVAKVLRTWGNDEKEYSLLMNADTPAAHKWRDQVAQAVRAIKPDKTAKTLWRGMHFATATHRADFASKVAQTGLEQNNPGMSASYSKEIATSEKFLSGAGVLMEFRKPRTGRPMQKIFQAIGTKYDHEQEVVFPKGSKFRLVGESLKHDVLRDRQPYTYLHQVYEETQPG